MKLNSMNLMSLIGFLGKGICSVGTYDSYDDTGPDSESQVRQDRIQDLDELLARLVMQMGIGADPEDNRGSMPLSIAERG